MKRGLFYGLLAAAGAGAIATVTMNSAEKDYYKPRMHEQQEGQEFAGAAEWWKMVRANKATGEVSIEELLAGKKQVAEMQKFAKKSSVNFNWMPVGPDNFGGRSRAFLIDKDSSNVLYAGSVSGGLFKSTNSGASWTELTTDQPNLAVTCIDQASDGTIYFGTGEGMYGSYNGNGNTTTPQATGGGIYKLSTSGQISILPSTVPTSTGAEFANVGKLEVDPNNPQRLYAATNRGLRRSDDGGVTWTNPLLSLGVLQQAPDMTVTPSGAVWVKAGSAIYKSPNGNDNSFVQITGNGIPTNANRMRIAVSPQDENYVYVTSIKNNQSLDKVYRSTDGGSSWSVIGTGGPQLNIHANQGYYNNALTVDPNNKDRIIVGGLDLYEWSDANGWQQLSQWFLDPTQPYYVHADNHNIVFGKNPGTFYIVNDGGIFRTTDNGQTFSALNKGYQTTQFYHIGLGPNNMVMGGTQDNGTFLIDPSGFFPMNGKEVRGGDGGYAQMSRLSPGIVFSESQRGTIARSTDYGQSYDNFIDRPRMDWGYNSNNPLSSVIGTSQWSNWIMPYKLWEKFDDPNSTDSLRLGADPVVLNLGVGGGKTIFGDKFPRPYSYRYIDSITPSNDTLWARDSSIFVPSSIEISAGNQLLTWDNASGELRGDGEGTFDPQTGAFTAIFNNPVNSAQVFAKVDVRYDAGTVLRFFSANGDIPVYDTLPMALSPGEEYLFQDPRQAFMVIGLRTIRRSFGNHDGGIWMTREVLSDVSGVPEWWHIAALSNNEAPTSIDVSGDGDMVVVGTDAGNVWRISNLINARDSASADIDSLYTGTTFLRGSTSIVKKDLIYNSNGQTVTGVAFHPFDKDKLVITIGNYGGSNHVVYVPNASAASPSNIQVGNPQSASASPFPAIPAYCAIFNFNDPDATEVLVGTEYGVFVTDDITRGTATEWAPANDGLGNVMVLSLQQDLTVRYDIGKEWEGGIWAGTYGRGIHRSNYAADYVQYKPVSLAEYDVKEAAAQLNVYPNPTAQDVNIELDLQNRSDVEVSIRNIAGKLVKTARFDKLNPGVEEISVNVSSLPRGTYVISMTANGKVTSGKFIKY